MVVVLSCRLSVHDNGLFRIRICALTVHCFQAVPSVIDGHGKLFFAPCKISPFQNNDMCLTALVIRFPLSNLRAIVRKPIRAQRKHDRLFEQTEFIGAHDSIWDSVIRKTDRLYPVALRLHFVAKKLPAVQHAVLFAMPERHICLVISIVRQVMKDILLCLHLL